MPKNGNDEAIVCHENKLTLKPHQCSFKLGQIPIENNNFNKQNGLYLIILSFPRKSIHDYQVQEISRLVFYSLFIILFGSLT
jgi:hypothetical protein